MSLTLHPGTLNPARSSASLSSPNSMKPDSSLSIEMLTSCCLRSSNLVDGGELLLQLLLLVLSEVAQRHAQWWQGILRKKGNY